MNISSRRSQLMSIMPLLDYFRVSVHTDWSLSAEYFFFYTFTVNFNVYSEVCRYPKKNHFYPILGNLPRFGKHWVIPFLITQSLCSSAVLCYFTPLTALFTFHSNLFPNSIANQLHGAVYFFRSKVSSGQDNPRLYGSRGPLPRFTTPAIYVLGYLNVIPLPLSIVYGK
jgi:hypothetical protein